MQLTMLAADVCVKDMGSNGVDCRPRWGNSCPSDMYQCHIPTASVGGDFQVPSGLCDDSWKDKKCRRKHTKGKCHKKKVARNCMKTCTQCSGIRAQRG